MDELDDHAIDPVALELELLRDFHRTWVNMHANAKKRPDIARRKAQRLVTLTTDLNELRVRLMPGATSMVRKEHLQ